MDIPNSHQNQNGAALVIALMFLAIVALAGSTAVILTTTDIQIGGNYRKYTQTFYNAQAGVQFVIGTLENDLKNDTTLANGTSDILPTTVGGSEPFTARPFGYKLTISDITMVSDSPETYSFTSTCQDPDDGSTVQIEVQFRKADFDPAFNVGILSDGDITIHGAPNITGGMHANGNVTQTGAGTIDGDVSAHGSVSVGSAVSGSETPNADEIDVPLPTGDDFDAWRTRAQTPPNIYHAGPSYTYSDSGDQSHKIVFVDGDITVSGSALQNVTVIATGDITVSGSSNMNSDGGIGTAMIAGGDITFNGSSHLYGVFWCNGDFRCNGAGTLEGSIVAGGDIRRNGVFNFVQNNQLDNENLPPGNECEVITWKDLSAN